MAVSQTAIAIASNNQIYWSRISVNESEEIEFSWQQAVQPNVEEIGLLEAEQMEIVAGRTNDGQVILHAASGLQTTLNVNGRAQLLKCCSPFVYTINERAVL